MFCYSKQLWYMRKILFCMWRKLQESHFYIYIYIYIPLYWSIGPPLVWSPVQVGWVRPLGPPPSMWTILETLFQLKPQGVFTKSCFTKSYLKIESCLPYTELQNLGSLDLSISGSEIPEPFGPLRNKFWPKKIKR